MFGSMDRRTKGMVYSFHNWKRMQNLSPVALQKSRVCPFCSRSKSENRESLAIASTMTVLASSSCSPEELMKELANDTARFELRAEGSVLGSHFASISLGRNKGHNFCFAKIGSVQQAVSSSTRREQNYRVHKVRGDGRCMFRALALGMAINDGIDLNSREETIQADELRMSVEEAICLDKTQQGKYKEALIAIKIEETINRYCGRIKHPEFWGGEAELLVLSRMYEQPIIVYIPVHEAKGLSSRWNTGHVPIAEYGSEYLKSTKEQDACKPVRLLYSDGNHYDLLV